MEKEKLSKKELKYLTSIAKNKKSSISERLGSLNRLSGCHQNTSEFENGFQKIARQLFPIPRQNVVETNDGVYIDGKKIEFVSAVEYEQLNSETVRVRIEFFAASYEDKQLKK